MHTTLTLNTLDISHKARRSFAGLAIRRSSDHRLPDGSAGVELTGMNPPPAAGDAPRWVRSVEPRAALDRDHCHRGTAGLLYGLESQRRRFSTLELSGGSTDGGTPGAPSCPRSPTRPTRPTLPTLAALKGARVLGVRWKGASTFIRLGVEDLVAQPYSSGLEPWVGFTEMSESRPRIRCLPTFWGQARALVLEAQ